MPDMSPATAPEDALSRRKQLAFSVVLILLPVLALAAVAVGYYTLVAWRFHRQNRAEFVGGSFIQSDPIIGYSARPGAHTRHVTEPEFDVFTDRRGCREDGPGASPPADVDVLAVGCSFTFGFGVDNSDTFVSRAADRAGRSRCNAALPAYGTTAALLSLDRHANLAPDVVLYGFIGTHETRNLLPCATTSEPFCRSMAFVDTRAGQPHIVPPSPPSDAHADYISDVMTDHRFGLQDVLWAARRDWLRLTGQSPEAVNGPYQGQASDPAARAAAVAFLLDQMARKSAELGARLVVVYIPIPGDVHPMPDSLRAALADHPEIALADLTQAFEDYERQHGRLALRISESDAHPNTTAHSIIADAVAPLLADSATP